MHMHMHMCMHMCMCMHMSWCNKWNFLLLRQHRWKLSDSTLRTLRTEVSDNYLQSSGDMEVHSINPSGKSCSVSALSLACTCDLKLVVREKYIADTPAHLNCI